MSVQETRKVISRAVTDAAFREQLYSDPDRALSGYALTESENTALRALPAEAINEFASQLETRISMSMLAFVAEAYGGDVMGGEATGGEAAGADLLGIGADGGAHHLLHVAVALDEGRNAGEQTHHDGKFYSFSTEFRLWYRHHST